MDHFLSAVVNSNLFDKRIAAAIVVNPGKISFEAQMVRCQTIAGLTKLADLWLDHLYYVSITVL